MRYRIRYETRGFDEYLNIYDEKNKLVYYSVQVDYARPKRLLYSKANERIMMIDFGCDDIDEMLDGYPIYNGNKLIGHYDSFLSMNATYNVEFAHIVGPEWSFIEVSERLNFREYKVLDDAGRKVMTIKRPGRDFVCDIREPEDVQLSLLIASVEFWKYITTTREF